MTNSDFIELSDYYDWCGVWAPDISYYNEEYYIFYTLVMLKIDRSTNSRKNYFVKAEKPEGPHILKSDLTC